MCLAKVPLAIKSHSRSIRSIDADVDADADMDTSADIDIDAGTEADYFSSVPPLTKLPFH